MMKEIDENRLRRFCQSGNLINDGISSHDFAEVRKALDACIDMQRTLADPGYFNSYLSGKLALAFSAGLCITEQSELLTSLFQLGKLVNSDPPVFEARCKLPADYDGMRFNTPLTPVDLRLLATGMYFCLDTQNNQLKIHDTMVMLQIKIIERILFKRQKLTDGSYTESEAKKLSEYFQKFPDMIFEYLRHDEKHLVNELISFWEFSLQLAYGNDIPEACGRAFSEKLRQFPTFERHNHIRLLPMQPWECNQPVEAEEIEEEIEIGHSLSKALTTPISFNLGFSEMPSIGKPIKVILGLHFITGLVAIGLPEILLWSCIAITLASVFYRTCLHFKRDISKGSAPLAAFFIYLFAGFMSIGAFGAEGIVAGMVAAVVIHIMFPLFFGLALLGRRKFKESLGDLFGGPGNKRLK